MTTQSMMAHIADVSRLVRQHGFVAGGAARFAFAQRHGADWSVVMDESLRLTPQDIDIFGYNEGSSDRVVEALMFTGMWRHIYTAGVNTMLTHVDGELPVHVVRTRGPDDSRPVFGTPIEVISNFLVNIEQFALVGTPHGEYLIHERTPEAVAGVCDTVADYQRPSPNPFLTLMRLMKARSKGFRVEPTTVLDLMEEWGAYRNHPLEENKMLAAALTYLEDESYG